MLLLRHCTAHAKGCLHMLAQARRKGSTSQQGARREDVRTGCQHLLRAESLHNPRTKCQHQVTTAWVGNLHAPTKRSTRRVNNHPSQQPARQ